MPDLKLQFGFSFLDLHTPEGLQRLQEQFETFQYAAPEDPADLCTQAKKVARFLGMFFQIDEMATEQTHSIQALSPLYRFKRDIIQRRILPKTKTQDLTTYVPTPFMEQLLAHCRVSGDPLAFQHKFAAEVTPWILDPDVFPTQAGEAQTYIAWACLVPAGQLRHQAHRIFQVPQRIDYQNLVPDLLPSDMGSLGMAQTHCHPRDGFHLTDPGPTPLDALDQSIYCIHCHVRQKDSCSRGLALKNEPGFQSNPLGQDLTGCPLDQKISEMNWLYSQGEALAALVVITIDNPLVAATGDRICQDCRAACIFQQQDPVDVPKIESRILRDVLALPWGFEIYSLLTRWNPLRREQTRLKSPTHRNVLVVGSGPAGFTLAHYLLNEGHTVAMIEGATVFPLAPDLKTKPIYDIAACFEDLENRQPGGFGGVAEYGITVRWDKNFLLVIRLILERHPTFSLFGNILYGGTLTQTQAKELGFQYIALCTGAGAPKVIPLENNFPREMRFAADFLMALQLTGAGHNHALTQTMIRLPIVVIGGGLTAVDTATEAQAFYVKQVETMLRDFEQLSSQGQERFLSSLSPEQHQHTLTFLAHGQQIQAERQQAKQEKRPPNFLPLLHQWGGATIVYRKSLTQAPAYKTNHHELRHAFQEGVRFLPDFVPEALVTTDDGSLLGIRGHRYGQPHQVPAGSVFLATGTTLHEETSDDPALGTFGDCNKDYHGSVVKAMASAKDGYQAVSAYLAQCPPVNEPSAFLASLTELWSARVVAKTVLTPTVIELVIKAPQAARNTQPGQFFRFQNIQPLCPDQGAFYVKPLALSGAWVDSEKGHIGLIVLQKGGSTQLCQHLEVGDPVSLMGPTGTATHILPNQQVVLIGGGLGNVILFSIGQAFRAMGSKVLYIAGYRHPQDLFHQDALEAAADQIIWCTQTGDLITPRRAQDKSLTGSVLDALHTWSYYPTRDFIFSPAETSRVLTIGPSPMMQAVQHFYWENLKEKLAPEHQALAGLNTPMQCMMKGLCGQCIQKLSPPQESSYIFACACQDQPLSDIDFPFLSQRLGQNWYDSRLRISDSLQTI